MTRESFIEIWNLKISYWIGNIMNVSGWKSVIFLQLLMPWYIDKLINGFVFAIWNLYLIYILLLMSHEEGFAREKKLFTQTSKNFLTILKSFDRSLTYLKMSFAHLCAQKLWRFKDKKSHFFENLPVWPVKFKFLKSDERGIFTTLTTF